MSHRSLIGGTAREITGGRTLVGGTGYDLAGGRTLVGGTGREIDFSTEFIIYNGGTALLNGTMGEYYEEIENYNYGGVYQTSYQRMVNSSAGMWSGVLRFSTLSEDTGGIGSVCHPVAHILGVDITGYSKLCIQKNKAPTSVLLGLKTTATKNVWVINSGYIYTSTVQEVDISKYSGSGYVIGIQGTSDVEVSKIWLE